MRIVLKSIMYILHFVLVPTLQLKEFPKMDILCEASEGLLCGS